MRKYLIKPLFVVLLFGALSSCELINPEEDQPAYLHINKPTFTAGGNFGSDSHEIVSGWVYYNGRLLGVFDLPADLPVLHSGGTQITVEAGVVADGQRATRNNYPFYSPFTDSLNLSAGQSYEITPHFEYENFVLQPIYRDFENTDPIATPFSLNDPYSLVKKTNDPADSLYFSEGGGYFGFIQSKPDTTTTMQMVSNVSDMTLAQSGKPVYAEFNIRSTRPVDVGLAVVRNGVSEGFKSELKILPSNTWKKFYMNLENEVNHGFVSGSTPTYSLVFRSTPTGSGKDYIAIDNIRLIQFP